MYLSLYRFIFLYTYTHLFLYVYLSLSLQCAPAVFAVAVLTMIDRAMRSTILGHWDLITSSKLE